MRYQYLLFDLDGTITDPKEGITKSAQYALEAFGIHEPDADKLTPFIGPPLIDSFQEFYHMPPEQAALAVKKYRERLSRLAGWRIFFMTGWTACCAACKAPAAGWRWLPASRPSLSSGF